jgi:hypothetical protein
MTGKRSVSFTPVGREDFIKTWDRVLAAWCVNDLMPEGTEAALLAPVAAYRWAAASLVEHASSSEDPRHRKAAAIVAGFIKDAPRQLLDDLFERESERNAIAAPETLEPLYCQSVVEDIVFAGARWCREAATRDAAMDVLRKIVERTIIGEYWATSSYAMASLCRYQDPRAPELLANFARFASGSPPTHPSNPSFGTEREFARGLLSGSHDALDAAEDVLRRQEAAGSALLFDAEMQATVEGWLADARQIG